MVQTFLERYSNILPMTTKDVEKLIDEFADYKALSPDILPNSILTSAVINEVDDDGTSVRYYRRDVVWTYLAKMTVPGSDASRFGNLSKIAKLVLTVPHSNAGEERVFSVIHKIRRDDRGRMQVTGATLSSLVTVKMNLPESSHACYAFQPTSELLKAAKRRATVYYNQEVCGQKTSDKLKK
jgi:hypothetical protein